MKHVSISSKKKKKTVLLKNKNKTSSHKSIESKDLVVIWHNVSFLSNFKKLVMLDFFFNLKFNEMNTLQNISFYVSSEEKEI